MANKVSYINFNYYINSKISLELISLVPVSMSEMAMATSSVLVAVRMLRLSSTAHTSTFVTSVKRMMKGDRYPLIGTTNRLNSNRKGSASSVVLCPVHTRVIFFRKTLYTRNSSTDAAFSILFYIPIFCIHSCKFISTSDIRATSVCRFHAVSMRGHRKYLLSASFTFGIESNKKPID